MTCWTRRASFCVSELEAVASTALARCCAVTGALKACCWQRGYFAGRRHSMQRLEKAWRLGHDILVIDSRHASIHYDYAMPVTTASSSRLVGGASGTRVCALFRAITGSSCRLTWPTCRALWVACPTSCRCYSLLSTRA